MKRVFSIFIPVFILLAGSRSPALERTDLMPAAETFLRITGIDALQQEFGAAFGDRLKQDAQVQNFIQTFKLKLEKRIADRDLSIATLFQVEMLKQLHGELALVSSGVNKSSLLGKSAYLAAGASENDYAAILERSERLRSEYQDDVVLRQETFRQTGLMNTIIYGGQTNEVSSWMAHAGDTLLWSTDKEWIEQSVVRLQQEKVREPETPKLIIHFPIAEWMEKALADSAEKAPDKRALWNSLGLLNIEKYELEIGMKDRDLVLDGMLSVSGLHSGLLALLDTTPETFTEDRVIPPEATSFSYGRLDIPGFWKKLPETLAAMPPKQGAVISAVRGMFQQRSQLNIEHDLIAHLGRNFTFHTEQSATNQPLLISFELTDGEALEASFAKLLASPLAQTWEPLLQSTDFRGHTLYQLKPKQPDAEPATLCFLKDRLLFATSAIPMRNAILRLESDIRAEPSALQKAALAHAPGTAFGYGAMDHQRANSLLTVRMSDSSFHAGLAFASNQTNKKEQLKENEISLNHLSSFLGSSFHYAEAVPGGIHHRLIFETDQPHGAP